MQLKHFKKTFIMNNEWSRTCKVLKGLLDILICSKCNNNLYDPDQFLRCGHFLCVPCMNNGSTSCNECQLPNENKDTMKKIKRIAEACSIIANEIGYKHNIENLETKSNIPPIRNAENITNPAINPVPKLQQVKQNKRKGGAYLMNDHFKKMKWDKPSSAFRIPKNIDKRNHHGETKLQTECKKANSKNVEDLLKAGADPNATCAAGWTALQESSDYHHYEIVEILLKYNADVNKPGHEGRTALHEAVKNKDKKMIELLLRYGAKIDIQDDKNNKPIDNCESEEIQAMLDPNNQNFKIEMVPKLTKGEKSNKRARSEIHNRVSQKDIIADSINEHVKRSNNATSSRRRGRPSKCQDTDIKNSRKKTIEDYFLNINQPSTSRETNYDSLSRGSDIMLENKSSASIDLSQISFFEDLNKSTLQNKNGASKSVQNNACKKILTETFMNHNIVKSQETTFQASTSKIACNNGQTNHKNVANNTKVFKSQVNLKNNDSDDSDIELIFEATNGPVDRSNKEIKGEDNLIKDCASSQGSIDVVNYSSNIDTEDMIIDIEN